MMKLIVLLHLTFFTYLCYGRPQSDKNARILQQDLQSDENGYKFSYTTTNGIKQTEVGELKHIGTEKAFLTKQGFYSYIDPDNKEHIVAYVSNENGFRSKETTNQLTPDTVKNRLVESEVPDRIGTTLLITLSG